MGKMVKCRYKYCKHESKELTKDDAVGVGNAYYHADCYKEKKDKEEIVRLFLDYINPNTPVGFLRKVINKIIHEKEVPSEYLLFGLKYYIDHKIKLNYPAGLYYVIANKDVEFEYKRLNSRKEKHVFQITDDTDEVFTYVKPKKKTINNFMEG